MANKRKFTGQEDSEHITSATNDALSRYNSEQKGTISVSSMLNQYGGNRGQLARAMLGYPESGRLPARGTDERRSYDTLMKNMSRWLNYEQGSRGSQARNPASSSRTQGMLQRLNTRLNPPQGMNISITGWIGYDDGDYRYRTVEINYPTYLINTGAFLEAMRAGDTSAAYRQAFEPYASVLHVADATDVHIDFMN